MKFPYGRSFSLRRHTYTDLKINNYVTIMLLHQAHTLLNNGVADFTIAFTNKLSELIILFLKQFTKKWDV